MNRLSRRMLVAILAMVSTWVLASLMLPVATAKNTNSQGLGLRSERDQQLNADTQPITITSVTITGPLEAKINTPYSFVAQVEPISTSVPITYIWQATGQSSIVHVTDLNDTVAFSWNWTGLQNISVTALNGSGSVSTSLSVFVDYHSAYLPLIALRWPPVPYTPVLSNIDNYSGSRNFTIQWSEEPTRLAETYVVQESTNAEFTANVREVCSTSQLSCDVADQPWGTFFYRVSGYNEWGYGQWSNVQSATVGAILDIWDCHYNYRPICSSYDIYWSVAGQQGVTSILEEDTDPGFGSPTMIYVGSDTHTIYIPPMNGGTHYFRVKIQGTFGESPWSNVEVVSFSPLYELISNGGFEDYDSWWDWDPSPIVYYLHSNKVVHSGSWSARLGVYNNSTDSIYQLIGVPADAPHPRLSYWRQIHTKDSLAIPYDLLTCKIYYWPGGFLKTASCGQFSNVDQSLNWIHQTVDLSAFRGQPIGISFEPLNDYSNPTEFFIDDVSITLR
jgi:hypothetical protein